MFGRPLTRLYEDITPVAASAAIAGLKACSSYSFSTRGRSSEEVVSRWASLLLARKCLIVGAVLRWFGSPPVRPVPYAVEIEPVRYGSSE